MKTKNKITTKYKCLHCKFTETSVLDLDNKTKEIGEIISEDFAADKKRFCLSKEDGEKYIFMITDVLGGKSKVTSLWENGKVTNLEVVEY